MAQRWAVAGHYARLVGVNLLVFCIVAEVLALAMFYWDTGHLFYLYRKPYDSIPESREGRLTGEGLHPYFGPTHKPGYPFDVPDALRPAARELPRLATNNFGFMAKHDYPFTKSDDRQFVIGIFGGSVGVWFCQLGVDRMVEHLSRDGSFEDKELIPLCFSHEGYKQPQQLQVLSYFLSIGQSFDLVVNIDGFNEVALSSINYERGFDISMPSAQHMDPLVNLVNPSTLTPDKLQSLAAIARDKEQLNRLTDRLARTRIAAVGVALDQYYGIVRNRYRAELVRFDALPSNPSENSIIEVTPRTRTSEGQALFEQIAVNWANASVLMHDVLSARGATYIHVLQPNQYFTARSFGADEARIAINPESPFKRGAEQGYPLLLAAPRMTTLRSHQVRFHDATRLFDREPTPVYIDDCCHYTLRGYELLADFIAGAVLESSRPGVTATASPPGAR
jgi:hypothetical protein